MAAVMSAKDYISVYKNQKLRIESFSNGQRVFQDVKQQTRTQQGGSKLALFGVSGNMTTAKLKQLGVAKEYEIQNAISDIAYEVKDMIVEDAPKRTGAMAASVYVSDRPSQKLQQNLRGAKASAQAQRQAFSARSIRDYTRGVEKARGLNPRVRQDASSSLDSQTNRPTKRSARDIYQMYDDASLNDVFGDMPFNEFAGASRNSFHIGIGVAIFYGAIVDARDEVKSGKPHFFTRNMPYYQRRVDQAILFLSRN